MQASLAQGGQPMKGSTKMALILGSGLALLGGAIGIGVWVHKRSSAPAKPSGPTQPVWASLALASDGSISIPASTSFAISYLAANPNAPYLNTALGVAGAAGSGIATPTPGMYPQPPGQPAPQFWPAGDNGGTGAVRWSGVVSGGAPLLIPAALASGVSVWVVTGFQ
jgi:hypothetical protein